MTIDLGTLVDCPVLGLRRLLPQRCIDRHIGKEGLDSEFDSCKSCPVGAARARAAGYVTRAAPEPPKPERRNGCCNPGCQKEARKPKTTRSSPPRYCSHACKMAVDRVRARISGLVRSGRKQEAEDLRAMLDDAARAAGWEVIRRRVPKDSERIRSALEAFFGPPLVVDGADVWPTNALWKGLGYAGRRAFQSCLRRWGLREESAIIDRQALTSATQQDKGGTYCGPPSAKFWSSTRVFSESAVWQICLLSRRPAAASIRRLVLDKLSVPIGPIDGAGLP